MEYLKKLMGDRIYLSPFGKDDGQHFAKWMSDLKISDNLGNTAKIYNYTNENEWVQDALKTGKHQFSIVLLKSDEIIGNCTFNAVNQLDRNGEIGIFIGEEKHRGKGYGSEALRLLLDYGFNYMNLHNITLNVFAYNEQGINCYKNVGFKEIGRRREAKFLNGRYHDIIAMDILSTEFNQDYIRNKYIK